MADLLGDDFLGEPAAQPPAATPDVDPAAAFLASEQSDLAQIEQNVYDEVPANEDSFDPFGSGTGNGEPIEDMGFIESATVVPAQVSDLSDPIVMAPPSEPSPPPPVVQPTFTMPKIEPEIIKQWREDFKIRCDEIERIADEEKEQWKSAASEALDKFYKERAEVLEKNKKLNRENADALRVEQEEFDPTDGKTDQQKWDMVTQRIDFNAKGSCTKDTSRMRQVLLQLKAGNSD